MVLRWWQSHFRPVGQYLTLATLSVLLLAGCATGRGLHQPRLCEVSLGNNDKLVLVPTLHSSAGEAGSEV